MNNIVLIGRLTKDPVLKYLPTGDNTAIARFTLAVDKQLSRDKKSELEAQNKPTADFISIVAWGKLGEVCSNFLSKGSKCAVLGRIETGSYQDDNGNRKYTTEVVASNVEFLDSKSSSDSFSSDVKSPDGLGFIIRDEDVPF